MGCTASTPVRPEESDEIDPFLLSKRTNDAIEKSLRLEQQRDKSEIKLLLLGAGESGKSTVLKQLNLLHQGGFTHQERLQYLQVIWADVIQSMKILIIQARKLGIPLDCDDPLNNKYLFECKSIVLRAKALDYVDTSVAGGTDFLNDYVLKYSERRETKRRIQSTGRAEGFNEGSQEEHFMKFNDSNSKGNSSYPTPAGLGNERGIIENGNRDGAYGDNQLLKLDLAEIANDLNNPGDGSLFIERSNTKKSVHTSDNPKRLQQITKTDIARAITALWTQDNGIKQCYSRANEFQLEGSAAYYFDNVEKFAQPDYICSDEDILRGRIKTTGITENEFNIGSTKFKVLDAGGQRSERKKWIYSFDGITAVIFVLAVSEYDQKLFEDERVNRMHESMMLFDTLLNSRWFRNTPFILFLNKVDIFEEKVKRTPIRKYFPDYQGRTGDANDGMKYFEKMFLSFNRSDKPIYVKRTCATDTQMMKFVLKAVTDMIIQQNLKKSGMI